MNRWEQKALSELIARLESGDTEAIQKLRKLVDDEPPEALPLQPGDWVVMADDGETFEIKQTPDGKERDWWLRATQAEEDVGKALKAKLKAENELAFEVDNHARAVKAIKAKIAKAEKRLSQTDNPISLLLGASLRERLRFKPSWIDWPVGPLRDFIQAREERARDKARWASEKAARDRPRSGGVHGY